MSCEQNSKQPGTDLDVCLLQELKEGLAPLIKELRSGTKPDDAWLQGSWDTTVQAELCNTIAKDIGFDTTNGRLDVSVHPFTGGSHPTDVRMTTRFKEGDLTEGLTGAEHCSSCTASCTESCAVSCTVLCTV